MAIAYIDPIIYGASSRTRYDVRSIKSEFGDGYQDVTPDGINHIVQTGTIVHPLIPLNDTAHTKGATSLRAFLKANCGTNNIITIKNYMEDPTGTATLNVFLDSWTESYDGVLFTFTVNYREAFNG